MRIRYGTVAVLGTLLMVFGPILSAEEPASNMVLAAEGDEMVPPLTIQSDSTATEDYEQFEGEPVVNVYDPWSLSREHFPSSLETSLRNVNYKLGGQFRTEPNSANFNFHPITISDDQQAHSAVLSRMRLWLTVEPNPNVEGYIQIEMGHILWGSNFDFPKTYPTIDEIGIELRRGWVAYHAPHVGKWRIGVLDWHDSFNDTLANSDYDFQVGGVDWHWFDDMYKIWMGAFVPYDEVFPAFVSPQGGNRDAVLLTFDLDRKMGERNQLGLSVYSIIDDGVYSYPTAMPYNSAWDIWVGGRASGGPENLPLSAFAILNYGHREEIGDVADFSHLGWAARVGAGPIPALFGKFSTQFIYSSGEADPNARSSSEFRTVAQSFRDNFGAQGYWSYMHLTSPFGPDDVNDLGVGLQNRGLGLITVQGKFEYQITERLSATESVGWLQSAVDNPINGARDIGTELAHMFTYNVGGGLVLDFGGAYLFTGDFYRAGPLAPRPDNLFELFARAQLEF